MTEVFEMLDRWATVTGEHHGEAIEWETIDVLWRETQDLLINLVNPENEDERSRIFEEIEEACTTIGVSSSPKSQRQLTVALKKLDEATAIRR